MRRGVRYRACEQHEGGEEGEKWGRGRGRGRMGEVGERREEGEK